MAIYAISDLHLSFGTNKPMNIFGDIWDGYEEKIKENWISKVNEEDTVIIPGDISWGIDLKEALEDFKFIDSSWPNIAYNVVVFVITNSWNSPFFNTTFYVNWCVRINFITNILILNTTIYLYLQTRILLHLHHL